MGTGREPAREPAWHTKPFLLVGCFLLVLTLPLWLPIAFLIDKAQEAGEARFARRMKDRGRFKDWEELRPALEAGEGTLIVEQGHKLPVRVWWTADDVLASAPCPPPNDVELQRLLGMMKPDAFVSWCHKRYLDDDNGAGLLTIPAGLPDELVFAAGIRERFPGMTTIDTVYNLAGRESTG